VRFFFLPECTVFSVLCLLKRDGIASIDRSTWDRPARSLSCEKSIIVLDLEKRPNVGTNETDEAMMVFLEESRMIFADMRLHATSTPTSTPTRYHHHHQKYRAQNNNDCTTTVQFFSDKFDNKIRSLKRYFKYIYKCVTLQDSQI